MSDNEEHAAESGEIVFKDVDTTESPQMVTKSELDDIIEGWKLKFSQLSEGVRAIQKASCVAEEKFHAHMDELHRESCARDGAQERRIKRNAGGPRAIPGEVRPHTPGRGAPRRHAMRANNEYAQDVGNAVQTSTLSRQSTNPRQRSQRTTTEIKTEIIAVTNVPHMRTTTVIAATPSATPTTVE